jgi:hypothetical protein
MKKYIIVLWVLVLSSCNKDFLDRYPLSSAPPQTFFNSEQNLLIYSNSFYDYVSGGTQITADMTSDNVDGSALNNIVAGRLLVPTTASQADWTWGTLRNINYFLTSLAKAEVSEAVKAKYSASARFFRAWFYFDKMKKFGDVPWYSTDLKSTIPELYKGRDSRVLVTDSIIADLDYAIQNLDTKKSISRVSKWTALALKSRVCLFEGTFRKYHTEFGLQGQANELLQKAADASLELMDSKQYKLYTTGHPDVDYRNLFTQESANTSEMILAQVYDGDLFKTHNANGIFLTATQGGAPGLNKDLIESYLMKNGEAFDNITGSDTFSFASEVKDRDLRLSQTIRTPGYTRIGATQVLAPDFNAATTGYQCIKFVTGTNQDGYNTNTNDLPVFRYAEVLLNYAEAKAELGTIQQSDIDMSINLLRDRVGMTHLTLAGLTADPFLSQEYTHTSDPVILEVRRERRVELVMEGFRYSDLLRWKEGHLLAGQFRGMYFPSKGTFDLDKNGKPDVAVVDSKPSNPDKSLFYIVLSADRTLADGDHGYLLSRPTVAKTFDENKHYLYPLPRTELLLNTNLTQNPGWED